MTTLLNPILSVHAAGHGLFFFFFFPLLFVLVKSKTLLKQLQQKHSKNNTSYT